MLKQKRVSFGKVLEYSELHPESSDSDSETITKWPTVTIRDAVYSIRCLVSYIEQSTIGRSLSLTERLDTMSMMKPIVQKLTEQPDIVNLVTNVHGNLSDLYLPVNQLLADFVNMLVEQFRVNKTVIYIREGYVENIIEHKTNLHVMVDIPLCVLREYNFEQCVSVHTKPDGLSAIHQIKHMYSSLII